ncbi:MAG: bacillithiol biosynthesis cysteine-adding enzyme BshC [Ignavibacteriae bacterium]|nr:bacillithiol biosynthesis cysteine-adding enzyme BshC [Ignavibacteriota bacterium]
MHSIPFTELQFSHLFKEFISGSSSIYSYFPSNSLPTDKWLTIAEKFNGRQQLINSISATMNGLELSALQTKNLQSLSNNTTLAAVTGQQVGFLGGAMYTVLKAYSTVQYAKQISNKNSLTIVPIFWIEDNDADSDEAAKATLLSSKNELLTLVCTEEITTNIPVSERIFGDDIKSVMDSIEEGIQQSEFSSDILLKLREIYKSGVSWTSAFTQLLQFIMADSGILFISASVARKKGLFGNIIRKEIEDFRASKEVIENTSNQLQEARFHVQAAASDVNIFYHDGNKRLKLRSDDGIHYSAGDLQFSKEQIIALAESSPELFSPNVLLRPIIQDDIIPTIAYIAGPGEIAYLAQLHSAYKLFNVPMPIIKPRHSVTFMPPSVVRFLEKNNFTPTFFMRPWKQIEMELTTRTKDGDSDLIFTTALSKVSEVFACIANYAKGIDQSLIGAANAAEHQTEKQIEDLRKKINSAQKKRHTSLFDKSYETASILMPFDELQERGLSPIHWAIRFGIKQLTETVSLLTDNAPDTHFIIPLNFPHINQ